MNNQGRVSDSKFIKLISVASLFCGQPFFSRFIDHINKIFFKILELNVVIIATSYKSCPRSNLAKVFE